MGTPPPCHAWLRPVAKERDDRPCLAAAAFPWWRAPAKDLNFGPIAAKDLTFGPIAIILSTIKVLCDWAIASILYTLKVLVTRPCRCLDPSSPMVH